MSRSLLEVLRNVSLDPSEHAAFSADPGGYLAQYGYEDVPAEDLAEAFSLVADTLPADVAQTVPAGFGAEAPDVPAAGFGTEAAVAGEGFAGPSFDADPTDTTFGAVNGDFDDHGDVTDDLDDLDRGLGPADDPAASEALGGAGEPGDGFHFGEGSETLVDDYAGDQLDADDGGLGPGLDIDEGGGLEESPTPDLSGVDEGDTEVADGLGSDATGGVDDFDVGDGLDFGSSGDADIDDIGAF